MTARESLARARPLAVFLPVLKASSPLSTTNQMGATRGLPSDAVYPSLPVRVPSERKAITSSVSSSTQPRLVFGMPFVVPALEPQLQLVYAERGEWCRQADAGHE